VQSCGNEPGDVSHIDHQERADLVGDLSKPGEVDDARISAGAGDDQLRTMLLG
jgi:hypothetical protein